MEDDDLWDDLLLPSRTTTPMDDLWPDYYADQEEAFAIAMLDRYLNTKEEDDLLSLNREYQACLLQELAKLEGCLEDSRQLSVGRSRSWFTARMPSHVKERLKLCPLPFMGEGEAEWTQREDEALRKAILHLNRRFLLDQLQLPPDAAIEQVKQVGDLELLTMNVEGIPWAEVPERADLVRRGRSAAACRQRWLHHLHPLVNQAAWTETEDALLCDQKRTSVWQCPLPDRSPWQCIQRSVMLHGLTMGKWTAEEDARLLELIARLGRRWGDVAAALGGQRTPAQCAHRFGKTLDPQIRRGRWSREEDSLLQAAVSVHGQRDWWLVASYVSGRTDVQCRERYVNVLNEEVERGDWTEAEDAILREAVGRLGEGRWSEIAQSCLPRRTDNQCWRRWKHLTGQKSNERVKPRHQKLREVGSTANSQKLRQPSSGVKPVKRPRGRPRKHPLPPPTPEPEDRRRSQRLVTKQVSLLDEGSDDTIEIVEEHE